MLLCSLWCRPVDHAVNCVYSHYWSGKKSLSVQINAHKFIYFSLKCVFVCVCTLYQLMLQRLWTVQATKLYRPVFQNQPAWGWMWCGHVWACVHVLAYVCLHHVLFSKSLFTVWAGNGKMASSVAIRCMYCTCFSSDTSRPTECALQAGMRGIGPAHSSRACARSYQKWSKCGRKDCSWYPPPAAAATTP